MPLVYKIANQKVLVERECCAPLRIGQPFFVNYAAWLVSVQN